MLLLSRQLSGLVMLTPQYWYVFAIFGFTIVFYGLNNLLVSIVNGYQQFNKYVKVNIVSSIFGVAFTVTLVVLWGLPGALISAVTFQSLMIVVSILMLRHLKWLKKEFFIGKFKKATASHYFRYTLMTLTTALTTPIVQMLLRGYVMTEISQTQAGWWEGMNRISNMYLMVITSSFSVYYLPRLSEIKDRHELRHEIFKAYKIIVPMLLVGFTSIYFLRFFIIRLLFTPDFMPMTHLFTWQMAGDFFKICSWILGFIMIAKSMAKYYIANDILTNIIWLIIGYVLVNTNGIIGLTQSYLIIYILEMLVMVLIFRNYLRNDKTNYNEY